MSAPVSLTKPADVTHPQRLDSRFVQWLAIQALHDRHARLVEGGAEADAQHIDLAAIFIDLPLRAPGQTPRGSSDSSLAMPYLLGMTPWNDSRHSKRHSRPGVCPHFLLLGGPGSGKSTLTTMIAQVLRLQWVTRQVDQLSPNLVEDWHNAGEALANLIETSKWSFPEEPLPMRIHLPSVARWLATEQKDAPQFLTHYLASLMKKQLGDEGIPCDLEAEEVQGWLDATPSIYWILDGLDEVPASAGRKEVIDLIRTGTGLASRQGDCLLVATRPQGYAREFAELDEIELSALPLETARGYAEKLLQRWARRLRPSQLTERLQTLRQELEKPSVATLLQTPLHTTMATLLVANQGKLPRSRSELFEDYFQTILRRELNKPIEHGIQREDQAVLRALHTQAGFTLQVRSQRGAGARSTLRRREIREMLSAWYRRHGHSDATIQSNVERIMPFAVDRLVLLLHASEGEFEFGVRSLQEFFAAEALTEDEGPIVEKRLAEVATNPHWSNVLRLVASHSSREMGKRALQLGEALVATCRGMNDGTIGGEPAKRCFAGSELAMAFLEETQEYGQPVLHDPLWTIALEGACSASAMELGKLAANCLGTNGEKHRHALLKIVEAQFAAGGEAQLDGWQLLYGLLCTNSAEAVALADRYAPTIKEQAEKVVTSLFESENFVPVWLGQFLDQHLEWFLPESMWMWCEGEALPLVVQYSNLLVGSSDDADFYIHFDLDTGMIGWAILSIESDSGWAEFMPHLENAPASWLPWKRLAAFCATPSHVALADFLEAIDSQSVFERFYGSTPHLPWPIAACLYYSKGHSELVTLAPRARAGELGMVDDWLAAEARWRISPKVSFADVENALIGSLPWSSDIATVGTVFTYPSMWRKLTSENRPVWHEWLLRLNSSYSELFFRFLPFFEHIDGAENAEETPLNVTKLLDRISRQAPLGLAPDLTGPNAEEWFGLFDSRGRSGNNALMYRNKYRGNLRHRAETNIALLVERIRLRPDQWGLLDALFALIFSLPNTNLSALHLPTLDTAAPPRAHALRALFALLIAKPKAESRAAHFMCLVFVENGTTIDFRERLADVLIRRTITPNRTRTLLLDALDAAPTPRNDVCNSLRRALKRHLHRTTPSAFLTGESWKNHELPEPCLSEPCAVAPPVRIVRISELRNVRLFKETPVVDEPFPTPTGDNGQWIVIVGENGVGKTTLLRAIALALTSPGIATELLDKRLPILTNGSEGAVAIDLDTGTHAITIRRDETDRKEVVESRCSTGLARPWIVGYGVRRGNARGERDRDAEVGPLGELHTLFDHSPSLHNAIRWLADLDADILREQRKSGRDNNGLLTQRAGIWKAVGNALHTLLGVKNISVDVDRVVNVNHDVFGRVRLDALSDGYLTTAGWVIDMMARWIDRQRELDEHVGGDILRQMRGLVLIDEIDLHLHPVWQMKIIDDVRRLFPHLSFIVTTHNPLTLQGVRRGEVYVMRRNDSRIELVQKDIQPGHDVDRVLFEQFAVEQTFDKETRNLLKKHREMLIKGARNDDPARINIESEIGARFGSLGTTLTKERAVKLEPLRPFTDDERTQLLDDLQSPDNEDT